MKTLDPVHVLIRMLSASFGRTGLLWCLTFYLGPNRWVCVTYYSKKKNGPLVFVGCRLVIFVFVDFIFCGWVFQFL
jgi:hypothetical protein